MIEAQARSCGVELHILDDEQLPTKLPSPPPLRPVISRFDANFALIEAQARACGVELNILDSSTDDEQLPVTPVPLSPFAPCIASRSWWNFEFIEAKARALGVPLEILESPSDDKELPVTPIPLPSPSPLSIKSSVSLSALFLKPSKRHPNANQLQAVVEAMGRGEFHTARRASGSDASFSGTEYSLVSDDASETESHSSDLVPVHSPCVRFDFDFALAPECSAHPKEEEPPLITPGLPKRCPRDYCHQCDGMTGPSFTVPRFSRGSSPEFVVPCELDDPFFVSPVLESPVRSPENSRSSTIKFHDPFFDPRNPDFDPIAIQRRIAEDAIQANDALQRAADALQRANDLRSQLPITLSTVVPTSIPFSIPTFATEINEISFDDEPYPFDIRSHSDSEYNSDEDSDDDDTIPGAWPEKEEDSHQSWVVPGLLVGAAIAASWCFNNLF